MTVNHSQPQPQNPPAAVATSTITTTPQIPPPSSSAPSSAFQPSAPTAPQQQFYSAPYPYDQQLPPPGSIPNNNIPYYYSPYYNEPPTTMVAPPPVYSMPPASHPAPYMTGYLAPPPPPPPPPPIPGIDGPRMQPNVTVAVPYIPAEPQHIVTHHAIQTHSIYNQNNQQLNPGMTVFTIGILLVLFGLVFSWLPPLVMLMYVGMLVWCIGGVVVLVKNENNRDGALLSLVCCGICVVLHLIFLIGFVIMVVLNNSTSYM